MCYQRSEGRVGYREKKLLGTVLTLKGEEKEITLIIKPLPTNTPRPAKNNLILSPNLKEGDALKHH